LTAHPVLCYYKLLQKEKSSLKFSKNFFLNNLSFFVTKKVRMERGSADQRRIERFGRDAFFWLIKGRKFIGAFIFSCPQPGSKGIRSHFDALIIA